MATDPLLEEGEKLSINTFTGDGVTLNWEINFAGGYLSQSHVKAYTHPSPGVYPIQTIVWIGPNTIQISPAVPVGVPLVVYRDTPKDQPVVDFVDGSIINEVNLDNLANQAVFIGAETADRFTVTAAEALIQAEAANVLSIQTAADLNLLVGGNYSSWVRTDAANTFALAQTFTSGIELGSPALGRAEYGIGGKFRVAAAAGAFGSWATPWTDLNFTPGNYSTTTQMNTVIAAASVLDLAAAAADATAKVAAERAVAAKIEGFLFCSMIR